MIRLRSRLRAFLRSAAEEAIGAHIARLTEGGTQAVNQGRLLALANEGRDLPHLRNYGFRVFSQFGEDGILQHLIGNVPLANDRFVEIGVEDYSESNTRFLVEKDDWHGLIIDADTTAPDFLRRTGLHTRRSVTFRQSFVTAENVNDLLRDEPEDLALLSIDVDGNDYWLWRAVELRPAIVVVEYNNGFGPDEALVVPYDPGFVRMAAQPGGRYYGASLAAFEHLGREKGYALLGTSDGPNAFLVRDDLLDGLKRVTAQECWRKARYRETPEPQRLSDAGPLPVFDLRTGLITPLNAYVALMD